MKKEILPDLLKRYLRGETSPEESKRVDEWYLSLQENPDDISLLDPLELDIVENRILDRIKNNIEVPASQTTKPKVISFSFLRTPVQIAAAITAIAVVGLGAILFNQKSLPSLQQETVSELNGLKKITNQTLSVTRLTMEDGTVIALKPKSSVEYPEKFSISERKIILTGEAFFNVTKDKNRPFIISAADVTVKVLGTSFNITAYAGTNEINVAVRTGKVSVAKSKDRGGNSEMPEEVILTPNQEVTYHTTEDLFSKKLVDEPKIILAKPTLFETQYDGVPVVKILNVLEENYGVEISFDEQALAGCVLTTSMAEEGLYERVEIICKAIGAQYEITDTAIVIKSNGCH